MSECNILYEKLPAYIEGVLPEVEGREIERHLETCGHCQAVLADLKKTGVILAGLEEKAPPPWFTQKVMARIREEAEPERGLLRKLFFPLRVKIPLEVAASLLVAVLAWQVYKASPPEMRVLPETPPSSQVPPRETAAKEAEQEVTGRTFTAGREKKETRGAVGAKMEGRTVPGGSGGGLKKQEEAVSAARPVEAPLVEEKKLAAADRAETALPAWAPLKKSEPAEMKPTPAPAPALQAAPRRMERELREKDEGGKQKSEAFQDRAQVAGQVAKGGLQQVWTVRVRDVDGAFEKIGKWLQEAGAGNIRQEEAAGRRILSSRLGAGELGALFDRLKALGEVSPKEVPASVVGKEVPVRIELIQAGP